MVRSGAQSLPHPGYIVRIDPGPNPPDTALAEVYKVPLPGYGIRGMDVDRNGVVWVPLDSGHIGSFDRRKCKGPLNGAGAEKGDKCREGWSLFPLPGPPLQGDTGRPRTHAMSGSISTTSWGSAQIRRMPPATNPTPCTHW